MTERWVFVGASLTVVGVGLLIWTVVVVVPWAKRRRKP
jgi:hypothetical protein